VRTNPLAYNWRELARVRRELRSRDLDIAFSGRMHVREHVVLALSRARRRVAFALGSHRGGLTDAIPAGDPDRHKIEDWLELLRPFGGPVEQDAPRLNVSEQERRAAAAFLAGRGVEPQNRIVGIHPGASVRGKRWPLDRFAEVAAAIGGQPARTVVAFVAPDGYGAELAQVPGVISAKVDLRELIALLERCDVLVCNDSGPMHIAGALGVPTVSIFGSGIQRWFAPLGDGHRLLTAHCSSAKPAEVNVVVPYDIAGVRTSQVLDALEESLSDDR
jgi:ADP-heptose:LPS heptosyltransferase